MIFSLSAAIAPSKTSTNSTAEIFFAIGSSFDATPETNLLNNMPNRTGTVTIKNISRAMLIREISWAMLVSANSLTDVKTINGIVITHSKLMIAVSDIERATSPFAKEVNKLDVTPPGAAAIIMIPIANSGAIGHIHIFIRIKAIIGSKIICEKAPTKKSRDCLATLKKSLPVSPSPNANIIKANAKGKNTSVTIPISTIIIMDL